MGLQVQDMVSMEDPTDVEVWVDIPDEPLVLLVHLGYLFSTSSSRSKSEPDTLLSVVVIKGNRCISY